MAKTESVVIELFKDGQSIGNIAARDITLDGLVSSIHFSMDNHPKIVSAFNHVFKENPNRLRVSGGYVPPMLAMYLEGVFAAVEQVCEELSLTSTVHADARFLKKIGDNLASGDALR